MVEDESSRWKDWADGKIGCLRRQLTRNFIGPDDEDTSSLVGI